MEYTILEHPSDIGIEAYGKTLSEAFQNAAKGLMSIILDLSTVCTDAVRKINIQSLDKEQLLVKWLSEILYLYDGQRFVSKEFQIHHLDDGSLNATVCGTNFQQEKHRTKLDVKAVTYHQIAVHEDKEGASVRIFFDI